MNRMTTQQFTAASKDHLLIRSWRRRQYNVMDPQFGAKGDGVTDDTDAIQAAIDAAALAGGGKVVLPATGNPYLISGPLRDTGGANAQLLLPAVKYGPGNEKQIVVTIEGELPAPLCFSVMANAATPDQHTIIKSTLATPGNVFGAWHPTSYRNISRIMLEMRNLSIRMPGNTAATALDLRRVAQLRIDGVSVDTGQYGVESTVEPTNTSAYALRLPMQDNGALTHVGSFGAIGMYYCVEVAEHANVIGEVTSYGCKVGVISRTRGHTMRINRLNVHHQPYGVQVRDYQARMDIAEYNNEPGGVGTWREHVADIDDPSDLWYGQVRYGLTGTFVKIGGANVTATNIGNYLPA